MVRIKFIEIFEGIRTDVLLCEIELPRQILQQLMWLCSFLLRAVQFIKYSVDEDPTLKGVSTLILVSFASHARSQGERGFRGSSSPPPEIKKGSISEIFPGGLPPKQNPGYVSITSENFEIADSYTNSINIT